VKEKLNVEYQMALPDKVLSDFVKCFWYLNNCTNEEKVFTILPDGHFDILFFSMNEQPFQNSLIGLGTKPTEYTVPVNTKTFAISFKLLAANCLLNTNISSLINKQKYLPDNFWDIEPSGFHDFECFTKILTEKMIDRLGRKPDPRKLNLFNLLYVSDGSVSVDKNSSTIHWESRQINRYFKNNFGISLKSYCTILRYRASFEQLKDNQLYPERNYTDQSHFIKEVKRFSSVTPKKLAENKNDRFIQLSTLQKK
jgi:AraC-like DNA-binding protein